ncbi:MAG TPA: LCP family protein [Polyangiaceae bacterium]|nr:LCP family protein [Polyangiaceae bacterium]
MRLISFGNRVRLLAGVLVVGLGLTAKWLLGGFGTLEQEAAHGAITPLAPPSAEVPIAKVSELPLEPRVSPLSSTQNILIAGIDRRPGEKGSGLTDTLVVAALNRQTGHVGLISIPRDIAVEIPKVGLSRINMAYALAATRGENAIIALKQAVGTLLALPIEHAVVIDLSVFERLVDTLGGITVDVSCPIIDDFVDSRTADGRRILDVGVGRARMDGVTAAMYVRSRHGRSDFSRARRQQAVLTAIHNELLDLGNLGQLPEAYGEVQRSVATDLKRYELFDLARRVLGIRKEQVHGLVFSETEAEPRFDQGRAMLFPNLDAIDSAVGRLFSYPAPSTQAERGSCPPADIALRHKRRLVVESSSDAGVNPSIDGGSQAHEVPFQSERQ